MEQLIPILYLTFPFFCNKIKRKSLLVYIVNKKEFNDFCQVMARLADDGCIKYSQFKYLVESGYLPLDEIILLKGTGKIHELIFEILLELYLEKNPTRTEMTSISVSPEVMASLKANWDDGINFEAIFMQKNVISNLHSYDSFNIYEDDYEYCYFKEMMLFAISKGWKIKRIFEEIVTFHIVPVTFDSTEATTT
jgi:hypothetical protein